ncbi:von Willebrand factor type A domain protein, partial [Oesophagostomum dentatum]
LYKCKNEFRPITVPGPKFRPVFRAKNKEEEPFEVSDKHVDVVRETAIAAPPRPVFVPRTSSTNTAVAPQLPTPSALPTAARTVPPFRNAVQHTTQRSKYLATKERETREDTAQPNRMSSNKRISMLRAYAIQVLNTSNAASNVYGAYYNDNNSKSSSRKQDVLLHNDCCKDMTFLLRISGCLADIIFLMDFSDGTGDKSKRYLDIAAAAVGRLPIASNAVRVGLIRYSGPGRAETLFHLDKHSNKDRLIEELFRMEPTGGTTRTGEAIHYALKEFQHKKHGARKFARKFLVVFTDGYSQEDPSTAAEAARAEGVIILAVASDDKIRPNHDELLDITRRKDMILVSPNGQQLREKILENQCPL